MQIGKDKERNKKSKDSGDCRVCIVAAEQGRLDEGDSRNRRIAERIGECAIENCVPPERWTDALIPGAEIESCQRPAREQHS
jgi:hypothetical protein